MRLPLALVCATLPVLASGPTDAPQRPPPALEPPPVYAAPTAAKSRTSPRRVVETAFGISRQVNVNPSGLNVLGDAANEPSLCIDPNDCQRIAVGWRQFNSNTNDFRQAGYACSTNGGVTWLGLGLLETNVFRSDPVLASDAGGQFHYLSLYITPSYQCDLWTSTNGGVKWRNQGFAYGGDKQWFTIDTSSSPGRGHLYQAWSPYYSSSTNGFFTRSTDGGFTWMTPMKLPQNSFWGTLDVGAQGELHFLGTDGTAFWYNRSLNVTNRLTTPGFDLTRSVALGGTVLYSQPVNPAGLVGQPWIAVDRSSGSTRGNLYALCSIGPNYSGPSDVMFARSTNGGTNWSAPVRLNDDPAPSPAWQWFGTLSVAPNGRVDACWLDTRSNTNAKFSELYYTFSRDGGLTWATNRAVSPPFNHTLGYPVQQKMGDYIGMVSLDDSANIAYTATFNGEEDIYFLRLPHPPHAQILKARADAVLTWPSVPGRRYCVEAVDDLSAGWNAAQTLGCVTATNSLTLFSDGLVPAPSRRFYRVVEQP